MQSARLVGLAMLALLVAAGSASARMLAEVDFPTRPATRVAIVDEAKLISSQDLQRLQEIIDATLTETAIPIVVVTIRSMRSYGAGGMNIEKYAGALFDSWGIGHQSVQVAGEEVPRNLGVLLLVSQQDRKARIELGADWGRTKDDTCAQIMRDYIIASFKRKEFSAGILAGVDALSAMVREQKLPAPPRPWWYWLLMIGGPALAVFTVVSLIRRGSSGWAWLFWGAVFTMIGFFLVQMMRSRRGGGGFSGGSFGGGFSGGGGATGSW